MGTEKNNKIDIGKWGKWGIIGYILALPIMIWKSSRIGKLIFIAVLVSISIGLFSKVSDVFFNKIRYRLRIEQELEPVKKEIALSLDRLSDISVDLNNMETTISEAKNTLTSKMESELKSRYTTISKLFDEVEQSLTIIKESERQEIKERIIGLKEQVKIHEKSIDSSEIRLALEEIADKLYILTEEERHRFYADLKEIGFKIEKEREQYTTIYSNTYSAASCAVLYSPDSYATGYYQ